MNANTLGLHVRDLLPFKGFERWWKFKFAYEEPPHDAQYSPTIKFSET